MIPEDGFMNGQIKESRSMTFRTMKTNELKEVRNAEIEELDDSVQYVRSKE